MTDDHPAIQLDCQGEEEICLDLLCPHHANPPSTSSSITLSPSSTPSSPNYMEVEDVEEDYRFLSEEERRREALLQIMQNFRD